MLDSISVLLAKVVPFKSIALLLLDEERGVVRLHARHPDVMVGTEWSFAGTPSGEAIEKQKPVFVEDARAMLENFPELRARLK